MKQVDVRFEIFMQFINSHMRIMSIFILISLCFISNSKKKKKEIYRINHYYECEIVKFNRRGKIHDL